MKTIENIVKRANEHINYRMGAIMGIIGGGVVYSLNQEHGTIPAVESGFKQFLYNLFIGGYNIKTCEKIIRKYESNQKAARVLGTIVPSLQAFLITYGIHKIGQTPDALESTAWQIPINLLFFGAISKIYLKK